MHPPTRLIEREWLQCKMGQSLNANKQRMIVARLDELAEVLATKNQANQERMDAVRLMQSADAQNQANMEEMAAARLNQSNPL